MATSEAQKEATRRYQLKLKSFSIRFQPEEFEAYKKAAESLGLPLRQLFIRGADEYIDNHLNKK